MTEATGAAQNAELLRRISAGDPVTTRLLVQQQLPRLQALASRMREYAAEAEDVVQERFMRLWRQAPNWRSGTPRVDTWLQSL